MAEMKEGEEPKRKRREEKEMDREKRKARKGVWAGVNGVEDDVQTSFT